MNTLFINGKIATLDSKNSFYEALGVKYNLIQFLGTNAQAEDSRHNYNEVIDLKGKVILPGFNDSHMHLLYYGYALTMMDLTTSSSIDEIITASSDTIFSKPKNTLSSLLGRGWNQDRLLEKRFPTKDDLDKISTDIPIIFTRICGHIAVCNSKALSYLDNIDTLSDNPHIILDKGLFMEDALYLVYNLIPKPTIDDLKNIIVRTCNELLSYGITSVQSDDLCAIPNTEFETVLEAYNELLAEKKLPLRIYEQCLLGDTSEFNAFVNDGYRTGDGNNNFKIGPLKLLLDGALGGRTALLRDPYTDDKDNCGIATFTQNELNEYIKSAHDNGFQIAAHAIGDKAMDMFLNSLENLGKDISKSRHGIVHCQITNKDIISRMKKLGVTAYIQPIFLDYDMHIVKDRVGERYNESYAFKTMSDLGIKLSMGSDSPVVHFNPFENIYSAVCRKDLNGSPVDGFIPNEKLSLDTALKIFTSGSAYSSFDENLKGSLEIGKLADLVVLDRDIFEIPEDEIKI